MVSAMSRRLGLAALAFTAAIPLVSQTGDDRPESVSSSQWIKLDGRWVPASLEQSHQFVPAR